MLHININMWILILLFLVGLPFYGNANEQKGEHYAQYEETRPKKIISINNSRDMKESESKSDDKTITEKPSSSNKMIVYTPPHRGAPGRRVDGASRGSGITVLALVPDHVGFTVNEDPSLFWYLSEETPYSIEFTLIERQAITPLIEKRLPPSVHPGINRIRLDDYGTHLTKGVTYQWFVSIIPDPDHRSKDIIAGGDIERMVITEALHAKLTNANSQDIPHLYAEEGLWYDSLSAISDLIDSSPNDQSLKTLRASLLKQVGLGKIAE